MDKQEYRMTPPTYIYIYIYIARARATERGGREITKTTVQYRSLPVRACVRACVYIGACLRSAARSTFRSRVYAESRYQFDNDAAYTRLAQSDHITLRVSVRDRVK